MMNNYYYLPFFVVLFLLSSSNIKDGVSFQLVVKTTTVTQRGHRINNNKTVLKSSGTSSEIDKETLQKTKKKLFDLISSTPSNAPTSKETTTNILSTVQELKALCPTPEEEVIPKLAGNWELLWTAQDLGDNEDDGWGLSQLRNWINPIENQAWSNNPSNERGRSNPLLPRPIQDRFENLGLIEQDADPVKSSQSIDLKKKQVRNVVAFTIPSIGGGTKATLTVTVDFTPNSKRLDQIDVKFQGCRVAIQNTPINFNIPLGPIGPTGWLRTFYIDDKLRITKGHKGSIFILTRP